MRSHTPPFPPILFLLAHFPTLSLSLSFTLLLLSPSLPRAHFRAHSLFSPPLLSACLPPLASLCARSLPLTPRHSLSLAFVRFPRSRVQFLLAPSIQTRCSSQWLNFLTPPLARFETRGQHFLRLGRRGACRVFVFFPAAALCVCLLLCCACVCFALFSFGWLV